jgi:hypothetical protein
MREVPNEEVGEADRSVPPTPLYPARECGVTAVDVVETIEPDLRQPQTLVVVLPEEVHELVAEQRIPRAEQVDHRRSGS